MISIKFPVKGRMRHFLYLWHTILPEVGIRQVKHRASFVKDLRFSVLLMECEIYRLVPSPY